MRRYIFKKGRRYTFLSIVLIGIVVVILLALVYYNSLKGIVERHYGDFKVLTIREAFENAFKNVSIQPSGFAIVTITAIDEMGNIYTARVTKEGLMSIAIGNQISQNPEELYKAIYAKAFYNLVLTQPIADFESSDPKNVLKYLNDVSYDYFQEDGREYVVLVGKDEPGNTIQIVYNISKVNGKIRIIAEKVFVNGKLLSDAGKRIFLAKVYKKSIEYDLIEVVKNSFLKDYPGVSIGEVFSKLNNARWTIKNESKKMVEFNGMDVIEGKETVITIGFKIDENGETIVSYALLNGQDVDKESIPYLLSYLYNRYSNIDRNKELDKYKQIIFSTKIPNSTKTFGELFTEYATNDKWNIEYAIDSVKLSVTAQTMKNDKFYMEFIFRKDGVYLGKATLNGEETEFDVLTNVIFGNNADKVQKVKSGKIVKYSSFTNNEEAFRSYLKNPTWSYDKEKDRVILTGVGKYGTKNWNFTFVFDLYFGREPILESMYMDGIAVIDEVSDYIVSKIFKVDTLGNNLVELVKNSIFISKTYEEILGPKGWKLDRNNDRVLYTSDNLQITFAVEPAGQVKVVQLFYNGEDWTTRSYDVLKTLENGGSLISLEQSQQKPVEPEQPQEQPQEQTTTPQYGQF
ncbi:hypothetical protein QQE94_02770 [Fervidobacterium pennivorans subsp. shakshaketiis]|uniref:hypothetical protein n=1 Tax=Fervidobacterium pennivorans TaxID=93466 RepID=UPI00355AF18D